MSDILPIVVAAPSNAREQLLQKNILPRHFFRNLETESVWENHSEPAIYLWPYDIPYVGSDKFRDEVTERVGDVPAFFGMDPKGEKDHQERVVAKFVFESIFVHVIFLDNKKKESERNETYAKFCTFDDIIQWSNNLKSVMEVRFKNNEPNSKHILVIIASQQQVITTQKEIKALNDFIGESRGDKIKPFQACYFMDMNLNPGDSNTIIHSKYVWDVQVSRLLLALFLSQEQNEREDDDDADSSNASRLTSLHEIAGVKVWRAEEYIFSIDQKSCQAILKKTLECASETLMSQQVGDNEKKWSQLEKKFSEDDEFSFEDGLKKTLEPQWKSDNNDTMSDWRKKAAEAAAAKHLSFMDCYHMMFYDWATIPVEPLKNDLLSLEHWKTSLDAKRKEREEWAKAHPAIDYTKSVKDFFGTLKSKPGILNDFTKNIYTIMLKTHKKLKENKKDFWSDIATIEAQRRRDLKTASENSKELKKAQDYYVTRSWGLVIVMAVTLFFAWAIWQICSLFNATLFTILSLSGMVFLGAFLAYFLMLVLHNYAGNHAANELVKEYDDVDNLMKKRDEKVKNMFFQGVVTRDVVNLQNVRFRTLQLAKRVFLVLQTELQPQLSTLADDNGKRERTLTNVEPIADRDHVRDHFLEMTQKQGEPFVPDMDKFVPNMEKVETDNTIIEDIIKDYFSEEDSRDDTFLATWRKICSYDMDKAGYYPAKVLVEKIRSFKRFFFERIREKLLKSIEIKDRVGDGLSDYVCQLDYSNSAKNFLSASLPQDYTGEITSYMFYSPLVKAPSVDNIDIDLKILQSKQLENTTILAFFYQEYPVQFAISQLPGAKTEYGQLTFVSSTGDNK